MSLRGRSGVKTENQRIPTSPSPQRLLFRHFHVIGEQLPSVGVRDVEVRRGDGDEAVEAEEFLQNDQVSFEGFIMSFADLAVVAALVKPVVGNGLRLDDGGIGIGGGFRSLLSAQHLPLQRVV